MQGDIANNMYPIPDGYQRIFNQLTQSLHRLVNSDLSLTF